jgi:hypothetical protein
MSADAIRKQVEFYLSDANLRRDVFFQAELKKNAFIPIPVFLNCNMIRKLTKDAKLVANAVEKSEKLVLNEGKNAIARKDHASFDLDALVNSSAPESLYVFNLPIESKLSSVQGGEFDIFPKDAYVKFNDQVTSRKWILPHAVVEFGNEQDLENFLARENVEILPDPVDDIKFNAETLFALKS